MKLVLPAGSTSVICHVFIPDSTSTAGAGKTALAFGDITAYYVRAGGALTALTMVDQTTLGTWDADAISDKLAFKLLHDTNAPGLYELSLPNNILAAGATSVVIQLRATGAAPTMIEIQLAGVDVAQISNDADAANNLEDIFDDATSITNFKTILGTAPGAAGGLFIAGSNAATTVATWTCTAAATNGSTVLGNTTMGTLTQTGAALLGAGSTVTFGAFTVTGNTLFSGTTIHTGKVTHSGDTQYTGQVDYKSTFTVDGATLHTGITTFTGAVALTDVTTAGSLGKYLADILADTATIDTAGEIAAAVWSADATTYQTQGTFGQAIGDPGADTNSIFKATVTDAGLATVGLDVVEALTRLPDATAGAANGLVICGTNAPVTITGSGSALTLTSTGANGHGLLLQGNGTGSGLAASGGATGNGIYAVGDGTGHGIYALSGDGTVAYGIFVSSQATLSPVGLYVEDGTIITNAHGIGMRISAATDYDALQIEGAGTGHGVQVIASGTGDGFLADSFRVSGLTTHTGAVLHSGTTTFTQAIVITDQTTSLSLGKYLADILEYTNCLPATWVVPGVGTSTLTTGDIDGRLAAWGKTGFALASTGADLILSSSTFTQALTDAIWDEVLATHVGAGSAAVALAAAGAGSVDYAALATAVWQDATAGDFTVSGSIGKSLAPATLGTTPGAAGGHSTHSAADVYTAFGTGANLTALASATNLATIATAVVTTIPATITTIDTLLDKFAPLLIGTVTGAGTASEVFVYGGVTATVVADVDGNRASVTFT